MNQNNEWLTDYEDFLKTKATSVSQEVTERVYSKIERLLNPNPTIVFLKIFGFHLVIGFLSLSFCHQFGMNPFNTSYSLAEWFMKQGGYYGCMIGCGVSFITLSLFAAGLFLTVEEAKVLKRTELVQNAVLGIISLGIFAAFGVELAVGMAGLWLLGILAGGFVATNAVWKLKIN